MWFIMIFFPISWDSLRIYMICRKQLQPLQQTWFTLVEKQSNWIDVTQIRKQSIFFLYLNLPNALSALTGQMVQWKCKNVNNDWCLPIPKDILAYRFPSIPGYHNYIPSREKHSPVMLFSLRVSLWRTAQRHTSLWVTTTAASKLWAAARDEMASFTHCWWTAWRSQRQNELSEWLCECVWMIHPHQKSVQYIRMLG